MNVGGFSSKKAVQTVLAVLLSSTVIFPTHVRAEETDDVPFTDIANHWAKDAILDSYDNQLMSGIGKTKQFQPERMITRAEFLVLIDRLFQETEMDFYPLTLMAKKDEFGHEEVLSEAYLPYKDVDRMTWMYPSILHVFQVYNRLYGANAFEQIYPAGKLHPDQPISREEAAKIMQLFITNNENTGLKELMSKWGFLQGDLAGNLKRAEAAVISNRLFAFLQDRPILPLLDVDDSKFPFVPEITELFPMFADYGDGTNLTEAENTYIKIVNEIIDQADDERTYETLKRLQNEGFPNRVGVFYYQSWNQFVTLEENLDSAVRALSAFLDENPDERSIHLLQLLSANIYDLSLQIGQDTPAIFEQVEKRISPYLDRVTPEESKVLQLYLAALDVKSGKVDKAIERYRANVSQKDSFLNAVFYLLADGKTEEAKQLVIEYGKQGQTDTDSIDTFIQSLLDEVALLDRQKEYAERLSAAITKQDELPGYQVTGESNLSGYLFKYVDQIDNQSQITRTTGFYKAPSKLVLDKIDMYSNDRENRFYTYDFDNMKWNPPSYSSLSYAHEWVQEMSVDKRLNKLGARYHVQSAGTYDVITEWIPGKKLKQQIESEKLTLHPIKDIPIFITKYYIDRASNTLLARAWNYEEIYNEEFIAFTGSETYSALEHSVKIPVEVTAGKVNMP
ncbi:S-layer homology domain-containing protein [Brevibacillus sp. SYSU BS000544]|uniref:S-layer homology domain-containing protein n=1 Tax=Brevibacillus sp. SYSU BS000544 TaxID=3416443 RepID=UPI003CE5ABD2